MNENEKAIKRFLMPVLRRATYRWKPRDEAMKAARIERGVYKCASCSGEFGPKEISLDHIESVIPLNGEGFTDWNKYIQRLFCEKSGFQVLCHSCHDSKTLLEDNMRTASREVIREKEKAEKLKIKLEKKNKKE